MKRLIFTTITALLFGASAFAQDIITLKSGNDIRAVVQEIGVDDVKYKKFDNPNGPSYTLKKSEIFMIKYANGDKDLFTDNSLPSTTPNSSQQNDNNQPNVQNQEELFITKSMFSGIKVKNSSGVTLLSNEITSTLASVPEALRLYNNGVTLKGVGTGFGIAGGVFLSIGFYKIISYDNASDGASNYFPWGWYIGGLLCFIPQAIFISAGNSKIDSAIGVYNASTQRRKSLSFGITQSGGIGFTFKF